jgi:hypothetical protein
MGTPSRTDELIAIGGSARRPVLQPGLRTNIPATIALHRDMVLT